MLNLFRIFRKPNPPRGANGQFQSPRILKALEMARAYNRPDLVEKLERCL